jgi:hypothetical protein
MWKEGKVAENGAYGESRKGKQVRGGKKRKQRKRGLDTP